MIPNPGDYLRAYVRKHHPEMVHEMRLTEISASAHVDTRLRIGHRSVEIRLMLPHTAPIEAMPLLAWVRDLSQQELWTHKTDPHYYQGIRVHLYRSGSLYLMLYVKPDIDREWLPLVRPLEDLWRTKPLFTKQQRWLTRYQIARQLGYFHGLHETERRVVERMIKNYKNDQI